MYNLKVMIFAFVVFSGIAFVSCNKKFDAPGAPIDPSLTATISIKDLKALHTVAGQLDVIDGDLIIAGLVVANDQAGNLYKELIIQDGTGAIKLMLNANNLYNTYPVGRRVFVKCKGLCLSDYNKQPQLGIKATVAGIPSIESIPTALISKFVVGGSLNNPVTPLVVSINDLSTSMQDPYLGALIQINECEFSISDTSKTYSDTSAYKENVSLNLKTCSGGSIIIRTSGYAKFAGINVPNGNGTLTAIYTLYNTTKQLVIRDTSDVQFSGPRCGSGPVTLTSIADIRSIFTGTKTNIPSGKKITGIVISDRTTANLQNQNLVLQQGNGLSGIVVRFSTAHSFDLGDSLDINVSGNELSEFNGWLQVNGVTLSSAVKVGSGKTITPRIATLPDINSNFEAWESTLITTGAVALSGGTSGTYKGSVLLSAGGSTLTLFTSNSATFAATSYPSSASSVTGYLTQFNSTKQMQVRNPVAPLNDVK